MAKKPLKRRQVMISEEEERYVKYLAEIEEDTINHVTRMLLNNALSTLWPTAFVYRQFRCQLVQQQQQAQQTVSQRTYEPESILPGETLVDYQTRMRAKTGG